MLIKMRINRMIFEGLTVEQEKDVKSKAGKSIVLHDLHGAIQVTGKKDELYELLFDLSKVYDIEII